jgi:hypothetical protein
MGQTVIAKPLAELLEASEATPEFKLAVAQLEQGSLQERITYTRGAPPVKILRVICKILEQLPHEPLAAVDIQAHSGCSNFTGSASLEPGGIMIDFDWDCRWRAQEQGWSDPFGDPDQIRAARTLDYQCFADFRIARPTTTE